MSGASPDRKAGLATLLAAYSAADALEAEHLTRLRALVQAPGDPFDRARYAPGHVTASSFVLSPDGSCILLILHGKLGIWVQPGGHVDPGDASITSAARREVAEEVSLTELALVGDGLFDVDVHAIPARKSEPAHSHYDVRFLFRAASTDAIAGSDARDARWVPLAQVDTLNTDASVLRAVQKLLPQP